jgi:hypothetical protein
VIAEVVAADPSGWISLIANFGTSGAVLMSVYVFLEFLKRQNDTQSRRYEEIADRMAEVVRENTSALRDFRGGPPRP